MSKGEGEALFHEAIEACPQLWAKYASGQNRQGQPVWHYKRRNFDLSRLEAVVVQMFGSSELAEQVFGVLESWGTDWFQREAEVDDFEGDCVIQFSGTCSFSAQSTSA